MRGLTQPGQHGKEVVEKFEAKDVETLEKNHPEAAKLYKKHGNGGAIQVIQGGGIRINGQVFPQAIPMPIAPMGQANKKAVSGIETALTELADVRKQLDQLKEKKDAQPADFDALNEKLKRIEKELFAAQAALE